MSFTSKVIKNAKETTQGDKRIIAIDTSEYLKNISDKSFKCLHFSDIYICCELFGFRKTNGVQINKKLDACNAKIKEVLDAPALKTIEKKDSLFDYERLCDEKYDLTEEERSFLWIINGIKDSLGFGLGRLYSTTKVFLVDSEDKDNSTKLEKAGWNKDENDLLGFYTKKVTQNSNNEPETEPQVWLIMDAITAEAKRLCLDRKYIIAKVYIHEMMHRFFDLRPDLGWKRSVKEIEEPMAEFATLKFIEELSKQSTTNEKLLPIALVMTEGLRKSMKHFIYALGVDLYYKAPIKLIYDYRRISMLLHKSGVDCEIDGKKLDLDPSPMKYVDEYVALCTTDQDLRKLVGPIKECIETYAKFFPLNKGIQ